MAKPQAPKLIRPKLNLNFGPKGDEPDMDAEVEARVQRKEVASLMNEVSGAPREVKSLNESVKVAHTGGESISDNYVERSEKTTRRADTTSPDVNPAGQGASVPAKPLQRRRARKKVKREHNFSCRSTYEHIDFLDALTNDSGTVVEGFERAVWLLAKEVARKKEYRGLPVSEETLEIAKKLIS